MLHKAAKMLRGFQCCQGISGSDNFLLSVVFLLVIFFVDFCFCKLLLSKEQYFSILWSSTVQFINEKMLTTTLLLGKICNPFILRGSVLKHFCIIYWKKKGWGKHYSTWKILYLVIQKLSASPVPCQLSLHFSSVLTLLVFLFFFITKSYQHYHFLQAFLVPLALRPNFICSLYTLFALMMKIISKYK